MANLANNYVYHITEEANKKTLERGKMKMMPTDLYKALLENDFSEADIEGFKGKVQEFEAEENVS